jgi:replicative DNA helicase
MNVLSLLSRYFPADRRGIQEIIGRLNQMEHLMALNTTRLLEAVEKQITENAGLRALVSAQTTAMQQLSADLKAATDALAAAGADIAALAQVQADLDAAADRLSLDDDATAAALSANTGTVPQPTPDA